MMAPTRRRAIPPRIGIYLAIFASALLGLSVLMLILEQLGTDRDTIRLVMIVAPLVLYFVVAVLAYALEPIEYFAAGRGVTALLNGLAASVTCLGGIGFVSLTGLFFFIGHDAFAFAIGWMLGLMVLGILLAPYLRKYGALTVPGYIGRRFGSQTLRVLSGFLLIVPIVLVLAAELKIGTTIVANFAGQPVGRAMAIGAVLVFLMVSVGGMFGLTWSNCAQAIAVFFGLLLPLTIVSLRLTNLPFPQISYGLMLEPVGLRELNNGLQPLEVTRSAFNLPGLDPEILSKPFVQAFGAIGSTSFVVTALVMMAGVASMPALLVRSGTTRSVYELRKSMGWAVFFVGLALMSMPAIAVFFRFILLDGAIGAPNSEIPSWFRVLAASGFVTVEPNAGSLTLENVRFARDGVFVGFAIAANLPGALVYLTIAGALAATIAAVTAHALALANMLTDDILFGFARLPAPKLIRLTCARLLVAVAVVAGGIVALQSPIDPFRLFSWGLALAASTIFPVLVMSIWWKRVTGFGALVGMLAGFGTATFYIVVIVFDVVPSMPGIDDLWAAAVGVPVGILATMTASLLSPRPHNALLEFVKDLRIPGGETIYDRELRIAINRRVDERL